MFKFLTALTAFVCISLAFPQAPETTTSASKDAQAVVVTSSGSDDAAGNFESNFETSNNIKADAKGTLKKLTSENGTETYGEVQQGSYSYVGDDGKTYQVNWVADENGFQPQADFLPTPPPASK
ncbi:larval cuticle protein 65Ag1-like [Chironomus tepperi]|uniref:larval cuticle protein 65Ag1-like n=1 Tax=Chironomus tepperi TaxID=113505 RepID=UPI00391F5CDE